MTVIFPSVSVVIPVYNRAKAIVYCLDSVCGQTVQPDEIIVVDDQSHDRSLEVAKNHDGKLYSLAEHLGKGYVLRAGFAQAKGTIIITIDSDGSHRPEELQAVLKPVFENRADLVIGSRYLNHKPVAARKLNAFGVRIFNFLIQILTGTSITDSQSGFRAMKREVLNKQRLYAREYEIESEMLVKAVKAGFRVAEVPISFEQRTYGRSGVDPLWDGSKILYSILLARFRG